MAAERGGGRRRGEGEEAAETANLSKTAELDFSLHAFGVEIDVVSPALITAHLKVTPVCCQPFKVLHGGVSALISEGLASIGAHLASGYRRVAGIQLSINHMKAARLGDLVLAEAAPIQVGRTIQVWQVQLWKMNPVTSKKESAVSSARVTLLSNMPVPKDAENAADNLMKHAKL